MVRVQTQQRLKTKKLKEMERRKVYLAIRSTLGANSQLITRQSTLTRNMPVLNVITQPIFQAIF